MKLGGRREKCILFRDKLHKPATLDQAARDSESTRCGVVVNIHARSGRGFLYVRGS